MPESSEPLHIVQMSALDVVVIGLFLLECFLCLSAPSGIMIGFAVSGFMVLCYQFFRGERRE